MTKKPEKQLDLCRAKFNVAITVCFFLIVLCEVRQMQLFYLGIFSSCMWQEKCFLLLTWLLRSWVIFFFCTCHLPLAEEANIFWRASEWMTAGLKGEPRFLPGCLYPTLPSLHSSNPAAVEGIYSCSPLFDAHCTYLHFSSLHSFHVQRGGGLVSDAGYWSPLCCRRGCSSEMQEGEKNKGGVGGGWGRESGADSGHSSSQLPQS